MGRRKKKARISPKRKAKLAIISLRRRRKRRRTKRLSSKRKTFLQNQRKELVFGSVINQELCAVRSKNLPSTKKLRKKICLKTFLQLTRKRFRMNSQRRKRKQRKKRKSLLHLLFFRKSRQKKKKKKQWIHSNKKTRFVTNSRSVK